MQSAKCFSRHGYIASLVLSCCFGMALAPSVGEDVWRSKKAEALMNAGMAAVAAVIGAIMIVAVPRPVASADHAFSALTGS